MFVVVQEIQLKKSQPGDWREYEVSSTSVSDLDGSNRRTWYHYYPKEEAGRFERPNKTAYKISIHQSYRENGRVKKKQCPIGTIGYYAMIEWGLYDSIDRGITKAAELFGEEYDLLYDMVQAKMQPIIDKAKKDWKRTEECKEVSKRKKIETRYREAKNAFTKKYRADPNDYDRCYNVFGEVMNQEYLDELVQKARAYEENTYQNQKRHRSSFNWDDFRSSYGFSSSRAGSYTEEERAMLKRFYKVLSMKFHPDLNQGTDTTKEMQLLNKLKEGWGV